MLYRFLHNNRITHIPSGSFKDMPALKRLRLDSNALVCDCGLMWLVKMLNVSSVQAAATCQTPNDMNGKSINGMMESDFKCRKCFFMFENFTHFANNQKK